MSMQRFLLGFAVSVAATAILAVASSCALDTAVQQRIAPTSQPAVRHNLGTPDAAPQAVSGFGNLLATLGAWVGIGSTASSQSAGGDVRIEQASPAYLWVLAAILILTQLDRGMSERAHAKTYRQIALSLAAHLQRSHPAGDSV